MGLIEVEGISKEVMNDGVVKVGRFFKCFIFYIVNFKYLEEKVEEIFILERLIW